MLEVLEDLIAAMPVLGTMQVLNCQENLNSFGDAILDLGTESLFIRIVRDKGKLFVKTGCYEEQLFDMQLVDAVLSNTPHIPSMDDERDTVEILRTWIGGGLNPLKEIFGEACRDETVKKLLQLRNARWKQFLAKYK